MSEPRDPHDKDFSPKPPEVPEQAQAEAETSFVMIESAEERRMREEEEQREGEERLAQLREEETTEEAERPRINRAASIVPVAKETAVYRMISSAAERLLHSGGTERAKKFVEKMSPFLTPGDRTLDLGTGTGYIAKLLKTEHQQDVHMLDTPSEWGNPGHWAVSVPCAREIARRHEMPYTMYDGKTLPFEDGAFDTIVIAFVMHHAENPAAMLKEAARVAKKRVIVFEDVPKNKTEARLNHFADTIVNFEFFGHPHQNKSREEWLELFEAEGLSCIHEDHFTSKLMGLPFFPNSFFVLDKKAA